MKILMISPFDLVTERLWGPTIRLHSLAKAIKKLGHAAIIAGPQPFPGNRPVILDGIQLYYFKHAFHRYGYPDDGFEKERQKHNRLWRLPFIILSRWYEIMMLIKKHDIDILYVNRAFPETFYPALTARLFKRVPVICDWDDIEGLHGFSTSSMQPLYRQLIETVHEVTFPRLTDSVVVASKFIKEFALKIGVKKKRLYYAPTVADSDMFCPEIDGNIIREKYQLNNQKILLYCGNLESANGVKVENMLYTLKLLLQKDEKYTLLVVGAGDLLQKEGKEGKLITLSRELGLSDHVIFTGGIPYKDVPGYIAVADICLALFPINVITMSKSPLKIYEYMACGKTLIARDIGEISQCIKDGESGILVYSDNPEEYALKIHEYFSQQDNLNDFGEKARKIIEDQFSWKHSAAQVLKACESILH